MSTVNAYLHNPDLPGQPFFYEGTRPGAVLLFHGLTATCSEVAGLGKALNNAGFTTAAPLLPGHGSSPADLNKVRWQAWVDSAETAYQDLARRYKRVFVGGESHGALLALYLAAEHPEIAGVMAYAPALRLPLSGWRRFQLRLIAPFVAALPKTDLEGNKTWQGYKVNPLKAVVQHMRLQDEVRKRLPRIKQPILIVQGRLDQTIDPRSAEMVYQEVCSEKKELHWMEKSKHCVLLDGERHEVTRMTLDFLFRG